MIPKNLKECYITLNEKINDIDREFFTNGSYDAEEISTRVHHTLGKWIRNNWGLWDQSSPLHAYMEDMGLKHPDDMSSVIIKGYWHNLNNKEYDMTDDIDRYDEYWAEMEDNKGSGNGLLI